MELVLRFSKNITKMKQTVTAVSRKTSIDRSKRLMRVLRIALHCPRMRAEL